MDDVAALGIFMKPLPTISNVFGVKRSLRPFFALCVTRVFPMFHCMGEKAALNGCSIIRVLWNAWFLLLTRGMSHSELWNVCCEARGNCGNDVGGWKKFVKNCEPYIFQWKSGAELFWKWNGKRGAHKYSNVNDPLPHIKIGRTDYRKVRNTSTSWRIRKKNLYVPRKIRKK